MLMVVVKPFQVCTLVSRHRPCKSQLPHNVPRIAWKLAALQLRALLRLYCHFSQLGIVSERNNPGSQSAKPDNEGCQAYAYEYR